jgi:hypothetical protein
MRYSHVVEDRKPTLKMDVCNSQTFRTAPTRKDIRLATPTESIIIPNKVIVIKDGNGDNIEEKW